MIWLSFCNYQLPSSSFKHLTGYIIFVLNFAWFSIHFWSELRLSLPFFCVLFLPSSPASCPILPLFRSRWLNFYLSFNLTCILPLPVLLTVVITSVQQSKMSLSRVSPFLFGVESFLSCRNLHVYTTNVFLSAG